ncbi:MAG: hypothetical protein A2509_09420 [Candidatus Edwardsbacteria bacterium RIFOXYD12_FULL_50_11]|uniref:Uncharacterized protein n=1 Tax=Candidatus Edwardsbacteria bacterium GWF2_54_11 TaxID=1817851 RepID=A0A1F5R4R4_9BACT|nr:MAG: hypothetical protein A2502_08450 [Candidatus Edwardsbacteria bacterium RifOxyC12_full_54_24]OGF07380.1 MAG: hypothetical protein A2273_02605 [Candidatus Edwardsbacteria bacterium RifOxyA12_full_54_48]OGF09454.1 MAG: hypothetical protein A2024_01695 [Candidatus Edwardsbacteria bacterium GWF2_54_11]OGF09632.1 MAG: hypothetical protein A3K15_09015 [Candidatus Edwardsbacteria bacterium GWE2_54_12]OGF18075.1 MAG: hypothetical protein A2509_09420 [Candidatus Edwardsbacteria bacterium RIFOXYD1
MKKILLTTATLLGLVLAGNAMSATDRIIVSKTVETAAPFLINEITDNAFLSIALDRRTICNGCELNQVAGAERLALKALKNVSSFLIKEFCRMAKAENPSRHKISYSERNNPEALITARSNLTALVR